MNDQHQQIVVIGAGYAGLLATIRLAGKLRGKPVTITLVNASDRFVERLRLHQVAANQTIQQRPIGDSLRGTGVEFVKGFVTALDPAGQTLRVSAESGDTTIRYDWLIYALGSSIDVDSVPGVRDHAYRLTPDGDRSALALREALPQVAARRGRMLIVGGGATGIEAAAEFADSYPDLQVRVLTRGAFGAFMGKRIGGYMRRSLERRGVIVQDNTAVREVRADALLTNSGERIPADLILWTGGFSVPVLARERGITVNERGQIVTDPLMRSVSHPNIYAIGDAMFPRETPGAPVRMSAYLAIVSGTHAADNVAARARGRLEKPFSFAYLGQGIALGHRDAIGFNNYPNDKPNLPYFTGRLGMVIREFFVKLLMTLPAIERRLPGISGMFLLMGRGRYAAMKRREARQSRRQQMA